MKQPADANDPDEQDPTHAPAAPEPATPSADAEAAPEDEPEVDVRSALETVPLDGEGSTPPLGTDVADWGGAELVESVYGPLSEFYEQLDARLREAPEDAPPVGWAPHIAALRALRDERLTGDWEVLARFLVAPASLEETEALRLVHVEPGAEAEAVRKVIKELTASDERALLIAPTPEQAADLLRTMEDDPEVFSLLIETRPETAEARSVQTRALPPIKDAPPPAEPPPVREPGSHGTVEFKPLRGPSTPAESASAVTRAEPLPALPDEPAADTTRVQALPTLPDDLDDAAAPSATTPAKPLPAPPGESTHTAQDETPATAPPHADADDSASDITRAEPLPALPEESTHAAQGETSAATSAQADADDSASDITRAEPLPIPPDEDAHAAQSDAPAAAPAQAETGDSASDVTRAEPLAVPAGEGAYVAQDEALTTPSDEPGLRDGAREEALAGASAPESRVRGAALRPVGDAWRQAWETEVRMLRRGLMWLEQWPRDAAALQAVQAENLRRGEELEVEQAALRDAIEEARSMAVEAEQAAVEAEAEAERLETVQEEAEAELVEPRAEADRLQAEADQAADEATAMTRTAEASYARCAQLDERAKTAQAELQGARQAEASLTDELARAREALPGAAEEAHRLTAADADAAAEGHAAYYRLVSAESALSGVRRKMTLGQKLHVASPPSDLKSLRAEVKARTREADEAAKRAREAKDLAEHAERVRRGLASFVSEGGARLKHAQEAQQRLGTELTWLAGEREKAGAEHQEHARRASEAVEHATESGVRARAAQQVAQEIEGRATAARTSREAALAAVGRARADAEAAAARAAETATVLDRRSAEASEEMSVRESDLEAVAQAEARTRENVAEICGADPSEDPGAVPAHQRRAMARIEQLTGYLEGTRAADGEVLLRTADVVVGTPLGAALTAPEQEFDALIAADAGSLTDAEFLIGAVRTRRWVLVGALGSRPPEYREYAGGPAPELSPFERAAVAAEG
ncbi:hypothetical protein HUT06_01645 [Actinomadura sp. NAK00032]|uniref:hypothetical protein n=1 Tax=Actinomadura sp. NAK00032 TaxID=2742128 RepID=UPI001590424E|nr:hypothetical protein [Actinomadura sp. NAK00032]QKW32898.1 hypothetical protein HUT06_01645 [Actinomadura sp. NAK00032]